MLKFQQIILRKFIIAFFILFLTIGGIVYYWTKEIVRIQTKNALLEDIKIIAMQINNSTNFDLLSDEIKDTINLRLTIIGQDGVVLAEAYKNKADMDNYLYKPEIMQATKEQYGYALRYSDLLHKKLLYVAKRYEYKTGFIYLRLSQELKNIDEQILTLGSKIIGVLILFFLTLFYLAFQISKQIENETLKIVNFLTALTKKTKETYIASDFSIEFYHITKLLTKVAQIIVKKEKQQAKHTQKLELANKQKDDIISAISHEFKNPIAVINGYSQTLLDDESINPNIRKKFLQKIYNNGSKLSDLIDTLRLSIKLDSKKQSLNFTKVNLYEIIKENTENIKVNYPNRTVKIYGDKNIFIQVDNSLFSVVISNLIENAIKYSEDSITISFNKTKIDVIDTGIGISKKNIKKITNKFYRVHENSWNNSLGLGLFIVSNIIELHNFKLNIISQENKGSTFSIEF